MKKVKRATLARRAPFGHDPAIEPRRTWGGLLLDADNTIFDYDRAEREALQGALSAAGIVPSPGLLESYRLINAALWKRFEEGAVSQDDLAVERFRILLAGLDSPADPRQLSRGYLEQLARQVYFLPHAREAVAELARRVPLGLVTNGIASVQRGRLERSGIGEFFRVVLISGELGISKPNPRMFLRAAGGLGLQPSEVLCAGDSPSSDIRGARAAGMAACWVAPQGAIWPPGEPAPDLVIHDLRGLLPLVAAPRERRWGDSAGSLP